MRLKMKRNALKVLAGRRNTGDGASPEESSPSHSESDTTRSPSPVRSGWESGTDSDTSPQQRSRFFRARRRGSSLLRSLLNKRYRMNSPSISPSSLSSKRQKTGAFRRGRVEPVPTSSAVFDEQKGHPSPSRFAPSGDPGPLPDFLVVDELTTAEDELSDSLSELSCGGELPGQPADNFSPPQPDERKFEKPGRSEERRSRGKSDRSPRSYGTQLAATASQAETAIGSDPGHGDTKNRRPRTRPAPLRTTVSKSFPSDGPLSSTHPSSRFTCSISFASSSRSRVKSASAPPSSTSLPSPPSPTFSTKLPSSSSSSFATSASPPKSSTLSTSWPDSPSSQVSSSSCSSPSLSAASRLPGPARHLRAVSEGLPPLHRARSLPPLPPMSARSPGRGRAKQHPFGVDPSRLGSTQFLEPLDEKSCRLLHPLTEPCTSRPFPRFHLVLQGGQLLGPKVFPDAKGQTSPTHAALIIPSPGSHAFVRCLGEDFLRVTVRSWAFGGASGHRQLALKSFVVAAGEVEIGENGELLRWVNKSGTFRPPPELSSQAGLPMNQLYVMVGQSQRGLQVSTLPMVGLDGGDHAVSWDDYKRASAKADASMS